ncbi:MAG: ATP phosphoribosyltransferase regulatory subunit, partial [Alphaproteobacteria bacterium]|nr:ATP phosphoribosyltransferase regulatory subunit [Alphaproteobacteria bacterium]
MSSIDLNPPRGMRDFLPKDWVFREKLMQVFNDVSKTNGFLHYETPVVDSYELFERKAGEEISDQLYDFTDKSNRHISLRAELTPSMVRLYAKNKESLPFPAKLYSIGQCFRYERATKGRKREHYQWNLDILGENNISAEAWILSTAIQVMNKLGLNENDFQIHVSNRALLSDFLLSIGVEKERHSELMIIIDKKDKIPAEVMKEMMEEIKISSSQIEKIIEFLDKKTLEEIRPFVQKDSLALQELEHLFAAAKALNIAPYLRIDTSIIRGLSYYTGIVFEAFDTNKDFRAIFGGGRYNSLFDRMTGKDIPACGLGFGDVVIEELIAS